jgi:hypothetical protein
MLTRIESRALSGCSSLKSICLPARLEMIGGLAFENTPISSITIDEGNHHFRLSGDFLIGSDGTTPIRYFGSYSNVTLPRDITILASGCFSGCASLRSLDFGLESKVTRIEAEAFSGCSSLESICLHASVEFLGENSFMSCSSLSSLTFESESKLTRIERNALYECTSLESILIPRSVTELRKDWAFHSSFHNSEGYVQSEKYCVFRISTSLFTVTIQSNAKYQSHEIPPKSSKQ